MPKIDIEAAPQRAGSRYPPPFDQPCLTRMRVALGDAGGLTDFGVNLLKLPPGAWSSQRHWHSAEDEFVWVLEGEVALIDNDGERLLRVGECAAFPKGDGNGHHLVNRSDTIARCLEIGSRKPDETIAIIPASTYTLVQDARSDTPIRTARPTRLDAESPLNPA